MKKIGSFGGRLMLLAACVTGGSVLGFVGYRLTGSDAWFLAIPGAVAVGWWFVADPEECSKSSCK